MKSKVLLLTVFGLALVLRLYRLGGVPPSLYWDEASLGYNAYSIATTLRDEHGEFLPYSRFIAFGDYKPPAYIYAAAGAIKIFGLSEWAVRLPSAIAGVLLVLVTYFLVREIGVIGSIGENKGKKTAFLAALLVAISPWSLQMSRAAFEANLATLFSGLGVYLLLRAIRTGAYFSFAFSALSFALSLYTFNAHRMFVPLLLAALITIFWREMWRNWKRFLLFAFCFLLFILPLLPHLFSREGQLRFYEVTWLSDLAPIELSNQRIASDSGNLVGRLLHNRRIIFAQEFLKHYTDHFRGEFLFFSGDANPKLSIQTVGELYFLELPFLLAGIYFLLRYRSKATLVILSWLLLSLIPAAFARETPHALRILQILPVPQIITAVGLVYLLTRLHQMRPDLSGITITGIKGLVIGGYGFLMFSYLHDYYVHYPKEYAMDWQYGYKEMVAYVGGVEDKYDYIQITNKYGRPYIYVLFYKKYSPENYWVGRKVDRDWYGFWYVHSFGKYIFDGPIPPSRVLYVREPEGTDPSGRIQKTIVGPKGEVVFNIYEL